MSFTCRSCVNEVSLAERQCPHCGIDQPAQAWLHLAAGLRFMQDQRFYRAQWELLHAKELDGALPEIDKHLARVAAHLAESTAHQRFASQDNMIVDVLPWGPHDWLCRPDIVEAEDLLLVRVHMPPGKAHEFHRHPAMEELIYVLEGKAEQWVGREKRILTAGEMAHIPRDVVHGTYNAGSTTLRFLAILSPAHFSGPALIDVSQEEPWRSLRK